MHLGDKSKNPAPTCRRPLHYSFDSTVSKCSAVKSRGHALTSLSSALDGQAAASPGCREKASASAWAYFRLGAAITVLALIGALVALAMRQSFR